MRNGHDNPAACHAPIGVGGSGCSRTIQARRDWVRAFATLVAPMILICRLVTTTFGAPADFNLNYTGSTSWNPETATFVFETSGQMPDTVEGFFWQVPAEVKSILIKRGVTVNGGVRVGYRNPKNPLRIVGEDRQTSVIHGTDKEKWTTTHGIPDHAKWKYGNVSVLADAVVYVTNLTARNPRGYNISGYAAQSIIHVANCNLVDTRIGDNNNSDGFVGATGSSIRDSLISTSDDAIKVYKDITIINVTIEQHRNGAAIQFGWGGESGQATAWITNLTIKGVDPNGLYNMAPFTWEAGSGSTRTVVISGLSVALRGRVYHEAQRQWQPAGLFELKPNNCTLNLTITGADIGEMPHGLRNTKGRISINGVDLP